MQTRTEESWRTHSDLVIAPDVRNIEWDGFACGPQMLQAGEAAAISAIPQVRAWLNGHAHPRLTGAAEYAPVRPG